MNTDQTFKAISDGTRRKILDLLNGQSLTAGEIAEHCQSTKPNISQHLTVLKKAGLIEDSKQGLYVYYFLKKPDFTLMNKEVKGMISIKEKILQEIKQLAIQKKCEPVMGVTDSHDEGTVFIMKDTSTILSFHYSFRLSSFIVDVEIPSQIPRFQIDYQDTKKIEEFISFLREEMDFFMKKQEEKNKKQQTISTECEHFLSSKLRTHSLFLTKNEEAIDELKTLIELFLDQNYPDYFSSDEKKEFVDKMVFQLTSIGKLHELMIDPSVSKIMINGFNEVWVEREKKVIQTDICFENEEEVIDLARKLANSAGRRIDNSCPMTNLRLPDNSRVTMLLPPIAVKGTSIIIQKHNRKQLTMNDLIELNSITKEAARFLEAAVRSRCNIIVTGGTGAGKTTTLNILSNFFSSNDQIVTIEDSAELKLDKEHVVKLETRLPNSEGIGEFSIKNCLQFAKQIRPDRILLSECQNDGMYEFLTLALGGLDGNITSTFGYSPKGALKRMEDYILQHVKGVSSHVISHLISQSLDLVVHIERLKDGTRKITSISQIDGYDHHTNEVILSPLFEWVPSDIESGKIKGDFWYTGVPFSFELFEKLERHKLSDVLNPSEMKLSQEQKKKKSEEQLLDVISVLSNSLRSGHTLEESFKFIAEETEEPLSNEFSNLYLDIQSGKTVENALIAMKERMNSSEFNLFISSILAQRHLGGDYTPTLRKLLILLTNRQELVESVPYYRKKELFESKEWQLLDFFDFLQPIFPSAKSLLHAFEYGGKHFQNNFSSEFLTVVKEVNAGKNIRDALRDLGNKHQFPALTRIISCIIQSQTFGSNVTNDLQHECDRLRKTLKQSLEKKYK